MRTVLRTRLARADQLLFTFCLRFVITSLFRSDLPEFRAHGVQLVAARDRQSKTRRVAPRHTFSRKPSNGQQWPHSCQFLRVIQCRADALHLRTEVSQTGIPIHSMLIDDHSIFYT
ncbi:uncharacterized protein BT62DRAFT_697804 [Guyanagaster necrorhizus]|uniref:Uncharacterized protein n=1 Tax=Guyanagaster necrorhizus TaxID=856835 RepID=A0A9P7VFG7_9AGAR|nr:uncharacterized protein BT62DRAFT_697804 [Guyanagaster necrorhizus MCA 3950]KAG7439607.1 hypothetical protein BT62DRAFT_697804 [Guyanagaster necrorhizus MCA 3950]